MKPTKFDEKELTVIREEPTFMGGSVPVYDTPISLKEAAVAAFRDKNPWWIMLGNEQNTFCPSVIPDHVARGFCFEAVPVPRERFGGKDMFGIEWEYIDVAGGSMVKPGQPLLEDVNDWKEVIKFPNIDEWDWEGSAAMNKEFLNNGKATSLMLLNGCWFERLISFMDFEGAAMALLDEDQEDALHELLHEMTSLYIRLIDKCCECYDLQGINLHDDWGSQMAPFFSDEAARNFFLPEMKRLVDHVHSKGMFIELHSCGHLVKRCDIFVEAGFDAWHPMGMNDTDWLYENYGDKILLGMINKEPVAIDAPEEEQRAAARKFVEKYCKPGVPVSYSGFYNAPISNIFREELYKASREAYAK